MRIVVCGAGIAGLTLAYWLHRFGHEPIVLERNPRLRDEGYLIYFYGSGFDVAEKMGLLQPLADRHYPVPHLTFVDGKGRTQAVLDLAAFRRMVGNRYFNFLRGDLERILYDAARGRADIRFGIGVEGVSQRGESVELLLDDGSKLSCDVLIGADGFHSTVRRSLWGDESAFRHDLDYYVAYGMIDELPEFPRGFYCFRAPGRQASAYSVRDGRLVTFFITGGPQQSVRDRQDRERILRTSFADLPWRVPELLEETLAQERFYFDRLSQIRLRDWSKGRVALVGDACQCLTLLSGQGASLAMAGAYLLALALRTERTPEAAFARYQERLRPEIVRRQFMAKNFAWSLVPGNRLGILTQDLYMRLSFLPGLGYLLLNQVGWRSFIDRNHGLPDGSVRDALADQGPPGLAPRSAAGRRP